MIRLSIMVIQSNGLYLRVYLQQLLASTGIGRCVHCNVTSNLSYLQVNETLLRSIVTQPSSENYVYAYNFSTLSQARNLLAGSTCQTYVPATTTNTPVTTTTTVDIRRSSTIPSYTTRGFFNGKVQPIFVFCWMLYFGVLATQTYALHLQGPSVNNEYLSQIQLYSIFSKIPVMSNMVLIITVCVKVAKNTFIVINKRTK